MSELIYTFGSFETVYNALRSVEDAGSDVERVQRKFANDMANTDKVPAGVVLGWQLAIYDIANRPGAVPMLGIVMNFAFEDYMRALFPDNSEFADAAIEFYNLCLNGGKE